MSFGPAIIPATHRSLRRALVAFGLALVAGGIIQTLSYPHWAPMPPELLASVRAQTIAPPPPPVAEIPLSADRD